MRRPAMPHHFQMKGRRAPQICLERQRLFLAMQAAPQPLYRQSARLELHGYARILKPAGREMHPRLQPGTAHPVRIQDASLACARRLHPAQGERSLFSIVGGKHQVPQRQHSNRTEYVNQQKACHNASSDAHGTSAVATKQGDESPQFNSPDLPLELTVENWGPIALLTGPGRECGAGTPATMTQCPSSFGTTIFGTTIPPPSKRCGVSIRIASLPVFPTRVRNSTSTCIIADRSRWSQ